MNYQTKKRLTNGIIYGVLALTVVSIIVITLVTLSTSTNNPVTPSPTVTTSTPTPPLTTHKPSGGEKTPTPSIKPSPVPPNSPTPSLQPTPSPTPTIPSNNDDPIVFTLPATGYVMKEYNTSLPVFSLTMGDYRTHNGIDISVAAGSAVVSIAEGRICEILDHPMMGKTVKIDHGEGLVSVYSNLDDDIAEGLTVGSTVGQGQLIGSVGFTSLEEIGESDHLHFEMTSNGKYVDPLYYLDYSQASETDPVED